MWKRSEVEQLTGLGRHTIQDLCNQNTSRDGLGFWEPAVMKPDYSRFDEGDLLAFYLVRQLVKVGFTPAEVGPVVLEMTEQGDAFVRALRTRAHVLADRRTKIDMQMSALERFEEAAADSAPEERLYAVMTAELMASAEHAIDAAASELRASDLACERARARLVGMARDLVAAIRGEAAGVNANEFESCLAAACAAGGAPGEQALLARAVAHFLNEVENGVPIELAFGKGSFVHLRQAILARTPAPEQ
ncbi:MAG TPA: hypothetical protein IAA22_04825 [Candidatus Olsenella stercoravium]|uniref:Uncharacterized protein n=1 Tax=Candidatus Olsenella stercoravium TaxID=2838713 RepID=A0A9D2DKA6_9ACTN|nr:hypothetical protein [Candidatus Olsenella stercoravium]